VSTARALRLLRAIFANALQRDLAHRSAFVMQAALTLFATGSALLALLVVFSHTRTLAGWTIAEVVVVLGFYQIVSGLLDAFVEPNVAWFPGKLRDGTLDDILLQPVPALFMASLGLCQVWALWPAAIGLATVVAGLAVIGKGVTAASALSALGLLACGTVIGWASRVLPACMAFWAPGIDPTLAYGAAWQLGRYPVSIYHPAIRFVLTSFVPVAFVSTIPARTLSRGASRLLLAGGLAAAAGSVLVVTRVWRTGLRRYTSATS
jgi:ABC-2 type transport system permease protein